VAKILIVDDDPAIVRLLEEVLQRDHLTCFAQDGLAAQHQVVLEQPDLVLLDLRMPDMDGSVLLPRLRALTNAAIIVLSGRDSQADRVTALRAGADDFVAKPFELDDLTARIEAVLRRSRRVPLASRVLTVGNLVISPVHGTVTVGGTLTHVTPIEWRILTALAVAHGEVLSYASLSQAAYHYVDDEAHRLITTHVMHLRHKLRRASPDAPQILGRRGIGFELR